MQSVYFYQVILSIFKDAAAEGATSLAVVEKVVAEAAKVCQIPSHQKLYPSLYPLLPHFPSPPLLLLLLSNPRTQGQWDLIPALTAGLIPSAATLMSQTSQPAVS